MDTANPTPRPEDSTVAPRRALTVEDFRAIAPDRVVASLDEMREANPAKYLSTLHAFAGLVAALDAAPGDPEASAGAAVVAGIMPGMLAGAREVVAARAAEIPSDALARLARYMDDLPAALAAQAIDFGRTLPEDRLGPLVDLLAALARQHEREAMDDEDALWTAITAHVPGLAPLLHMLRVHIGNAPPGGCATDPRADCLPWPEPDAPAA
jgi:hypothetical protein